MTSHHARALRARRCVIYSPDVTGNRRMPPPHRRVQLLQPKNQARATHHSTHIGCTKETRSFVWPTTYRWVASTAWHGGPQTFTRRHTLLAEIGISPSWVRMAAASSYVTKPLDHTASFATLSLPWCSHNSNCSSRGKILWSAPSYLYSASRADKPDTGGPAPDGASLVRRSPPAPLVRLGACGVSTPPFSICVKSGCGVASGTR